MKAIETTGTIDHKGFLIINRPLRIKDKKVRVIILIEEKTEKEEEILWLTNITKNPAFNFLNDKEETIYSLKDGKPIDV